MTAPTPQQELSAIHARAEELLKSVIPAIEAASDVVDAQYGGEISAMPSTLAMPAAGGLTILAALTQVLYGKETVQDVLVDPIKARAEAEGVPLATTDPFTAARDAQLEASRARHQIETHLNGLSQPSIDLIAEALAAGGQLRVVVRK